MVIFYIYTYLYISIHLISSYNLYLPYKHKQAPIYFKPISIHYKNQTYPIFDTFIEFYKNTIFDCMYTKVLIPGKYFKYFGLRASILYSIKFNTYLFGFIINLPKQIFFNKSKLSFYEFLYLFYDNSNDHRKLLFVDNTWQHNNLKWSVFFKQKLSKILDPENVYSQAVLDECSKHTSRAMRQIFINSDTTQIYLTSHKINGIPRTHPSFKLEYDNKEVHAYLTDLFSAQKNNFHGSNDIITPFFLHRKPSAILVDNHQTLRELFPREKILTNNLTTAIWDSKNSGKFDNLIQAQRFEPDKISGILKTQLDQNDNIYFEYLQSLEHLGIPAKQLSEVFIEAMNNYPYL